MRFASLLALTAFGSLGLVLVHCGDDDASGPGPASAEAGTSGTSGTATSSGMTSGGTSGASSSGTSGSTSSGTLPNWPPPSRAACTAPTIDAPTALVQTDGGIPNNTGGIGLAWSGKQAGLVFFQGKDGPAQTSALRFQRLDHHGAKIGDPVNLTAVQPQTEVVEAGNRPTLTSDGTAFLACWNLSSASAICASIPSEGASPVAGYQSGQGTYTPILAYDGIARVMVARGASVVLDDKAEKTADFKSGILSTNYRGGFAARSPGFITADAYSIGSSPRELHFNLVDSAGVGPEATLPVDADLLGVAGIGPAAVALVEKSGAMRVVRLAAGSAPADLDPTNATNEGTIAAAASSFGAVWLDNQHSKLRYRAISLDGTPLGASIDVMPLSTSSDVAMTAVDDGFLVATLYNNAINLVHLGCP